MYIYLNITVFRAVKSVLFFAFTHALAGVASPAAKKLTVADVYTSKGKPDPEVLKTHFIHEGRVEDEVAIRIIQQCERTILFTQHIHVQ